MLWHYWLGSGKDIWPVENPRCHLSTDVLPEAGGGKKPRGNRITWKTSTETEAMVEVVLVSYCTSLAVSRCRCMHVVLVVCILCLNLLFLRCPVDGCLKTRKKTESANFCRGNSCTCLFYLSWKWFFLLTHLSFDSFCRATFCPRSIYLYAGQMFVFSYLLSCLITYLTDVYWKTASFALMCCVFYIVWDRSDLPEYRGNKPPPLQ